MGLLENKLYDKNKSAKNVLPDVAKLAVSLLNGCF